LKKYDSVLVSLSFKLEQIAGNTNPFAIKDPKDVSQQNKKNAAQIAPGKWK